MSGERTEALPAWAKPLGYGGLVPFFACALLMLAVPDAGTRDLAGQALLGYAAVILSFLGGVHWGLALRGASPQRAGGLLAAGVLPSLVGWGALLLPFEQAAAVLVAGFGLFWLYEHRVLGSTVLPPDYLALRRWLTLGVVASMGLALMASSLVPTVP